MRKTFIRMAFIAIVAGFAACTPKITFTESDLHGKGDTNGMKGMVSMKRTY